MIDSCIDGLDVRDDDKGEADVLCDDENDDLQSSPALQQRAPRADLVGRSLAFPRLRLLVDRTAFFIVPAHHLVFFFS